MSTLKKVTGFTLIEVLVALVVLAIGLLGLAGLQATGLRNNQEAYQRSQATQLAYDLADRIRANMTAKTTYSTITPPSDAAAKSNCLTTAGCSAADMAENDLYEWNNLITSTLPEGAGSISYTSGIFTVSISWDEDHDGDNSNNHLFQTSFQL